MKLGMQVVLGPGHIVLDGIDPAPPPRKGHSPPIFSPYWLGLNGCMDQDVTWYMEVGLGQGDFVLDGDHAPPSQKGADSAHVYCGQTAGWMKLVRGM